MFDKWFVVFFKPRVKLELSNWTVDRLHIVDGPLTDRVIVSICIY